jgi:hypothetical protein
MEITGQITGVIKYKTFLNERLEECDLASFDINQAPSCCLVKDKTYIAAVSKWVTPKRTRSYPYERVYNTLDSSKKITVIPIVKDEGMAGDRDFLQWDSVSLMSLLDVFVILAYYTEATPKGNKITDQRFDNNYIISKIREIEKCHSSALHWNLNELRYALPNLINIAKEHYAHIAEKTKIVLHNAKGIDCFKTRIDKDIAAFMRFSRIKAKEAQAREFAAVQPKEVLITKTKAKITIGNYLGGLYYFTVDETLVKDNMLYLIESKHSKNSILPSKSDIKDGLLKMILYSNLRKITLDGKRIKSVAVLRLTSKKIDGALCLIKSLRDFAVKNKLSSDATNLIKTLFDEAKENGFSIEIKGVK